MSLDPTDFAVQIASRQYFHKDENGDPVENFDGMLRRVARHIARAEAIEAWKAKHGEYPDWYLDPEEKRKYLTNPGKYFEAWLEDETPFSSKVDYIEGLFYELMASGKFMPAGRILAGSGSRYGQLQNCFVLAPNGEEIAGASDTDSIDGIYELAYKLAKVTKTGGGCGINLDFLREAGSFVAGSGGASSGPVSFLRLLYATTLRVIKLEGVRRGAGMATMSIWHPDILDFITAKDLDREAIEGKIESFNISVLVSNDFMQAVEADDLYPLVSVSSKRACVPNPVPGKYHLPGEMPTSVDGSSTPTSKEIPLYLANGQRMENVWATQPGDVGYVKARWLWQEIVEHAWTTGDPGILFYDTINDYNPLEHVLGPITATNPCGEEPLFPGESCCLGSLVLPAFVNEAGVLNAKELAFATQMATRFLDNVLTMNVHPIEDTEVMCGKLRRIGLGIMGDADMVAKAELGFISPGATELRNRVGMVIRDAAIRESELLGEHRGNFPLCSKTDLNRRNVHLLSIAPTGTISMIADVSSGIEPIFALSMQRKVGEEYYYRLHPSFARFLETHYPEYLEEENVERNVAVGIDKTGAPQYARVLMLPVIAAIMDNKGGIAGLDDYFSEEDQKIWRTAHDLTPEEHLSVQIEWQKILDDDETFPMASISKTCNLPTSATPEDVSDIYWKAFKGGLKGITIYRDGSRSDQVLRTDSGDETEEEENPTATSYTVNTYLDWDISDDIEDVMPHRGPTTSGPMYKQEFVNSGGKERKVYLYIGKNEDGEIVETFLLDSRANEDVQPYAEFTGRAISKMLKYGVPLGEITDILENIKGGAMSTRGGMYQSIPAFIGRMLRNENAKGVDLDEVFIPFAQESIQWDTSVATVGDLCQECGQWSVVNESGCATCKACGHGKCT